MACLCGDSCCPWCGPAQGNYQCPICDEWFSEGCEHFNQETGAIKLEFRKAALEAIETKRNSWSEIYQNYPEMQEFDDFISDIQEEENDYPEF
jgi:hypothetical protein